MSARTYSWLVNCFAAIGVASALLYDRLGAFHEAILGTAIVSGIAVAVAYFYFHRSRKAVQVASLGSLEGDVFDAISETAAERSPVPRGSADHYGYRLATLQPFIEHRSIDQRKIMALWSGLAKSDWACTGSLQFERPTKDMTLTVIFGPDGGVRFVPVYKGGHGQVDHKQPLSQAPSPGLRRPHLG